MSAAAEEQLDDDAGRSGFAFARCFTCDHPGVVLSSRQDNEQGIRRRRIRCVNDDCAVHTWIQVWVMR